MVPRRIRFLICCENGHSRSRLVVVGCSILSVDDGTKEETWVAVNGGCVADIGLRGLGDGVVGQLGLSTV